MLAAKVFLSKKRLPDCVIEDCCDNDLCPDCREAKGPTEGQSTRVTELHPLRTKNGIKLFDDKESVIDSAPITREAKRYLAECWKDARRLPKLKCAARYRYPEIRKLIALCAQLQLDASEGQAFYLAAIDAGQFLGIPDRRAGKWLARLERDGVLKRHRTGTRHQANEYFFVGE